MTGAGDVAPSGELALVFEERDELSPRRILLVPSVLRLFQHLLHVQVFNEHGVVFADEPRRYLVLVVQHLATDVTFDPGDSRSLLCVVVRPLFFPRQLALFATESLVVVFEVELVHSLAIRRVDVVQDAEVNTHAVTRTERVQRGLLGKAGVVSFQSLPLRIQFGAK